MASQKNLPAHSSVMGFLTRFLVSKMEDPAKRQEAFETHMNTTVAKCAEV